MILLYYENHLYNIKVKNAARFMGSCHYRLSGRIYSGDLSQLMQTPQPARSHSAVLRVFYLN